MDVNYTDKWSINAMHHSFLWVGQKSASAGRSQEETVLVVRGSGPDVVQHLRGELGWKSGQIFHSSEVLLKGPNMVNTANLHFTSQNILILFRFTSKYHWSSHGLRVLQPSVIIQRQTVDLPCFPPSQKHLKKKSQPSLWQQQWPNELLFLNCLEICHLCKRSETACGTLLRSLVHHVGFCHVSSVRNFKKLRIHNK